MFRLRIAYIRVWTGLPRWLSKVTGLYDNQDSWFKSEEFPDFRNKTSSHGPNNKVGYHIFSGQKGDTYDCKSVSLGLQKC